MNLKLLRTFGRLWLTAIVAVVLGSTVVEIPFLPAGVRRFLEVWIEVAPGNLVFYGAILLALLPGVAALAIAGLVQARRGPPPEPRRLSLPLRVWRGPHR